MQLTTILRPSYQLPIYEQVPIALRDYKYIIVQSPAGSGKSVIISHTVARIISANKIPLVLTHRNQIQEQLLQHCQGVSIDSDVDHVFIQPGYCYVAMNQTLAKRPHILAQLAAFNDQLVIIIDECHYGIFNKVLDLLHNAYRIGFSATPAWRWAKHLPKYYNYLIAGPQIKTLINEGSLIPFEYHEMQVNLDGLNKKSTGDYSEESQFDVFNKPGIFDGMIEQLSAFNGKYNKGAIFCSSIKQCESVHNIVNEAGFNAVKYHSGMKKDGSYQKARFTDLNESNLIVSVSSLAEGWDYPPLDFAVLYRATTSLPLFIQMTMRTSRIWPGKQKSIIVDFGGNNTRFGGNAELCSMTMDRDWNALWQPPEVPPRTKQGVAAIQLCPACQFMLSALAKSCSNCGFIFPESEVLLKQGELIQIREQEAAQTAAVAEQVGRRISTLSAIELALYAKERDRKKMCMRIAQSRQLTEPGFIADYGRAIGYKPSWADRVLREQAEILMYEPEYKIEFNDIVIR